MRALFWVFFMATLLYGLVWLFKDSIRNWFFPNIVQVEIYGDAQLDKTRVDWTAEGLSDTLTIYRNGKQLTESFRSKGFNDFLFYYGDELISSFDQYKNSASSGHMYRFILWKKQDSVQLDLKIIGSESPL